MESNQISDQDVYLIQSLLLKRKELFSIFIKGLNCSVDFWGFNNERQAKLIKTIEDDLKNAEKFSADDLKKIYKQFNDIFNNEEDSSRNLKKETSAFRKKIKENEDTKAMFKGFLENKKVFWEICLCYLKKEKKKRIRNFG